MNPISTMSVVRQFQDAEEKISREHGAFTLFGLFERSDIFGKYDVVVSAPWLKNDLASLSVITDLVIAAIGNAEWWPKIGRFDVVPTGGPFLEVVREALPDGPVQHSLKRITNLYYEGNMIPSAMIITATGQPNDSASSEGKQAEMAAA